MDYETYAHSKLKEVRDALANHIDLDDKKAIEVIEEIVFSDGGCCYYNHDEIKKIIDYIFLRTRSKVGILKPLLSDDEINEIMVNGNENIFIEKNGKIIKLDEKFHDTEELEEVIIHIAGMVHRQFNERIPIVDARLEDGSRVNAVFKNIAVNGPALTIRKFSEKHMHVRDLVYNETITSKGAELLTILVRCGYNIFVSGGTSSGKTTLLNALAEWIPREERVIVCEDSMELKMNDIENIVRLECKTGGINGENQISMTDLVKTSLRMRPNRIIIGEVRGKEVLDMLNAMNTGHSGSMSTGHGNSVKGMIQRLEAMYLMASAINIDAVRMQISQGIDIMVHLEKLDSGKRRVVEIVELIGYAKDEFILNPLMVADDYGKLCSTGNIICQRRKLLLKGEEYCDRLRELGFIN